MSVLIARLLLATMFLRLVLVQPLRVLFGGLWDQVTLRLSSAAVPFSGATSSPRLCVATTTSSQASWNDDAGGLGFGLMHGNWGAERREFGDVSVSAVPWLACSNATCKRNQASKTSPVSLLFGIVHLRMYVIIYCTLAGRHGTRGHVAPPTRYNIPCTLARCH